jgi:glycosyltransferase involved in cell wall biosynthesis
MKRILIVSRCPPYPLYLGDRLIVYHLARELSRRGWSLDLLAFSSRLEDLSERPHYADFFQHIELIPEPRRTQISYLWRLVNPSARWPRRADDSWSPEMWRAMESRLNADDYDVIHLFGGVHVYEYRHLIGARPAIIVPYESYSLYLRRALEKSGQRSAISNQQKQIERAESTNAAWDSPLQRAWFSATRSVASIRTALASGVARLSLRLQRLIARAYESFMFSPYRRTVVVSPPDRDELRAINPALNVDVIPNGIDLDYFRQQDEPREPGRLLFVGNYEYPPNVDAAKRLALEILPQVQSRIPGVKLWLVGNAPPPELMALQSVSIEVTGRVPDVRPYYARAAVFVSALTFGAGIKNKVLEALAMGCPVVATPLSVDGIEVENGQQAMIADIDEMAEAIVRLLNDAALRQTLGANGRALIEAKYSWGRVAEMYEVVYETVVSK